MQILVTSLLLVLVVGARAAPNNDDTATADSCCAGGVVGTDEAAAPAPDPVGYRKETLDTLSRNTSEAHIKTQTKDKVKVKTKHRKDGSTVTIIKDKSRTKTKKDEVTDSFDQTNHTLIEGGVEDSESLTRDHLHEVKETDVIKKTDEEIVVRDKYGNVISDTHKIKQKEKTKVKAKDKEKKKLVHTVKHVEPATEAPQPPPESTDC